MAAIRPLVTIGGLDQQLPITDSINCGVGLSSAGSSSLTIASGDVLALTSAAAKNITLTAGASGSIVLTSDTLVQVAGNLQVTGTEEVIGGATFDDSDTFLGDVSIGNSIVDDELAAIVKQVAFEVSAQANAFRIYHGAAELFNIDSTTSAEIMTLGSDTTAIVSDAASVDVGTGTLNIPSADDLSIGGTDADVNFNATNFNALFSGAVVTTHTHSGLSGAKLVQAGLTKTAMGTGLSGYISAANTVAKTDSKTLASSYFFGVDENTASTMTTGGCVTCTFCTGGGSPVVNQMVYLASSDEPETGAAGKLTALVPDGLNTTAGKYGNYLAPVGKVLEVLSATSAVVKIGDYPITGL